MLNSRGIKRSETSFIPKSSQSKLNSQNRNGGLCEYGRAFCRGTINDLCRFISQATDRYRVSSTGKNGRNREKRTPGMAIITNGSHNFLIRVMFLALLDKVKIAQINGHAE